MQTVTTEREVKRKEKHYKSGASLVTLTIERYTAIRVVLECGHVREQHNGMRDITKAKALDCYECAQADYVARRATAEPAATINGIM